ncbi:epoxide hydrolase [Xylogone sp. PMI_703]|nr:epoxide hydrolase [Xylogone sp. PMI_703]
MSSTIKPFKIDIPDSKIHRLHQKLDLADYPEELEDVGWNCGPPLSDIKRLANHWRNGFDWRKQEARLNEMAQFTMDIDVEGFETLNVHFVHEKSVVDGAIPLLFIHGWPGSFIEVEKILPLLKAGDGGPAFHVVAPSLPNFGFSSRVTKKGFSLFQYAETLNKLMIGLGYDQYVIQGGDWGAIILRALAHAYPNNVRGLHTNMVLTSFPKPLAAPLSFISAITRYALSGYLPTHSSLELSLLERAKDWSSGSGRAYFAQMGTKPQTIGYSLADSPVGLLGWIYEKLVAWTDEYPWTDDEVLTWISIYYFSRAGPAAASFIYYEAESGSKTAESWGRLQSYLKVPMGLAYFPKELASMPRVWAEAAWNVVQVSTHEKGGHFAATERPDAIVKDLKELFGKGGKAFGVVKGKSGY